MDIKGKSRALKGTEGIHCILCSLTVYFSSFPEPDVEDEFQSFCTLYSDLSVDLKISMPSLHLPASWIDHIHV